MRTFRWFELLSRLHGLHSQLVSVWIARLVRNGSRCVLSRPALNAVYMRERSSAGALPKHTAATKFRSSANASTKHAAATTKFRINVHR